MDRVHTQIRTPEQLVRLVEMRVHSAKCVSRRYGGMKDVRTHDFGGARDGEWQARHAGGGAFGFIPPVGAWRLRLDNIASVAGGELGSMVRKATVSRMCALTFLRSDSAAIEWASLAVRSISSSSGTSGCPTPLTGKVKDDIVRAAVGMVIHLGKVGSQVEVDLAVLNARILECLPSVWLDVGGAGAVGDRNLSASRICLISTLDLAAS